MTRCFFLRSAVADFYALPDALKSDTNEMIDHLRHEAEVEAAGDQLRYQRIVGKATITLSYIVVEKLLILVEIDYRSGGK